MSEASACGIRDGVYCLCADCAKQTPMCCVLHVKFGGDHMPCPIKACDHFIAPYGYYTRKEETST